jgi:hypothetical protein
MNETRRFGNEDDSAGGRDKRETEIKSVIIYPAGRPLGKIKL